MLFAASQTLRNATPIRFRCAAAGERGRAVNAGSYTTFAIGLSLSAGSACSNKCARFTTGFRADRICPISESGFSCLEGVSAVSAGFCWRPLTSLRCPFSAGFYGFLLFCCFCCPPTRRKALDGRASETPSDRGRRRSQRRQDRGVVVQRYRRPSHSRPRLHGNAKAKINNPDDKKND